MSSSNGKPDAFRLAEELLSAYRVPHAGPGDPEISIRALRILGARYESTRNPTYAWKAYLECRAHNLALPVWAMEYFDRVADNIFQLSQRPPSAESLDSEIRKAVGFKGGVFTKDWKYAARLSLAVSIKWYLDHYPGLPETHAQERAAEDHTTPEHRVTKTDAWRAWRDFKDMLSV